MSVSEFFLSLLPGNVQRSRRTTEHCRGLCLHNVERKVSLKDVRSAYETEGCSFGGFNRTEISENSSRSLESGAALDAK